MKNWIQKRRLVQLAFIVLLIGSRFTSLLFVGSLSSSQLLGFSLSDPLAGLQIILASRSLYLPLILSTLPILVIYAVLGRAFCSWLCPVNTILEFLPIDKERWKYYATQPKYLILFLLLVATFVIGLPVFELITPINILARAFAFAVGPELLLVAILIVLELIKPRVWCTSLCPLGAFYSLLGSKRLLRLQINHLGCSECYICEDSCAWGAGLLEPLINKEETINSSWACTNCGKCIDLCPETALEFSFTTGKNARKEVVIEK
ncbi:4Fe-4S binding protein [Fuchsiella alkaliacetigena]|uniref:4Fe-4S binding protein n=1 Tax=Fuchsiella alkaliacetigena TaxID=957042 RepID=UPI002009FFE1|nr:4Fe-4S binding protein [Fuchsiella alkaliacetigena]MCK8824808.1 4Fe-4S binding protein [Fuchsiella alkaliacetigena]